MDLDDIYNKENQKYLHNLPKDDFSKDDPVSENDLNNIGEKLIGVYEILHKLFNSPTKQTNLNSNILTKNLKTENLLQSQGKISVGSGVSLQALLNVFLQGQDKNGLSVVTEDGFSMEIKDKDGYFGLFLNDSPFFAYSKAENLIYSSYKIKTQDSIQAEQINSQIVNSQNLSVTQSLSVQNPTKDSHGKNIPVNVNIDGSLSANSITSKNLQSEVLNVSSDINTKNLRASSNISSNSIDVSGKLRSVGGKLQVHADSLDVSGESNLNSTHISGKLNSQNNSFGGLHSFKEENLQVSWSDFKVGIEVKNGIVSNIWRHK